MMPITNWHVHPFQSTLSVRRATFHETSTSGRKTFQSTLSVRRATWFDYIQLDMYTISIHALRKESDL